VIASTSPIVRLGVRAASPLALTVAAFLFFAGHNRPGGGFAAGLVLGAVVALRTMAGLQRPTHATGLLTAGGIVAGLVALAPVVVGSPLLDQAVVETTVPALGKIKAGTALVFDAGVVLVVVGMVIAVLDGLGAEPLSQPSSPPVRRGHP